ncbi:serine/threonine protein phosphatase [Campylobacter troglodytis]|uniref:serine/threonine protein phosphatase n=1 Tax=Campylobacter troglodytis TaxID=654363 RepID=UPI0011595A2B|nr:serine/threonine protein phosphatase [Campylobacter troglodytis]TQR60704.1 serine/threonine protein phosphatase [Campylobacter troglodytis]
MRILLILRGNYFNGQKPFLIDNELMPYTLDLEELRFLAGGYRVLSNGYKSLDYRNASEILKVLFDFLELRMSKGEFCIVNAPNANNSLLKEYSDLANKYRYKLFIIDFNKLSLEECKQKNLALARQKGFFVPEHILEAIDYSLKKEKLSKKYQILAPSEWKTCLYKLSNLSAYKKIHHIGDIQGCFTVLKKALSKIKKDEFYVFLGDYIDRGIENDEVIKWLFEIKDLDNVILLEGNHERHLISWSNDEVVNSREFNENTLSDFKRSNISPKDTKKLCSYFKECFCYEFNEKIVFCSHGGLNFLPSNLEELSFVPTEDLIMGIGSYDDSKLIAEQFCQNTPSNTYELFGHRNRQKLPIQLASRAFLCEGKVDAGGFLRVVSLSKDGFECKNIKNTVYGR